MNVLLMSACFGGVFMRVRRLVFLVIVVATAVGMLALMVCVLAPGGWSGLKLLILVGFVGVVPWLGLCLANAVIGYLCLLFCRDPARSVLFVAGDIDHAPITTRTALAVTVRDEDLAAILPWILALGLDPAHFVVWVLSDTQDPALASVEASLVAAVPGVFYRRRADNAGFKAGNVMEFLDHHADGFDFVIPLDADSRMTAESIMRLVRIMQADSRVGLVQHLTVGAPASAAFPRLFQFGMRAGMRVWATGQAWWQGDEGPYWGHNAIFRVDAFRQAARLGLLPDGSPILSHDQVEAARLRAAGWRVCMWAAEEGSMEENPPALPEFLHRDARWMAGNLQYRHLLFAPGFRAMGRWQLVQAILLFLSAPLYPLMLLLAAINAAVAGGDVPRGWLLVLVVVWPLVIYAPKLAGYKEVLLFRARRERYGGFWAFASGAAAEIVFTLLLDAIAQPSKAMAMLRVLFGARTGWAPQNRGERGVTWREAAAQFWPHTLFGVVVFALLLSSSVWAALVALPFAGGLLVAVPFCVVTASPGFSAWLVRRRIAATPEELALPSPR